MTRRRKLQVARTPEDLKGSPLERREFMNLLKLSGGLVLGSSLAGCTGDDTSSGSNSSKVPEELVIGRPTDADLLDPHRTTMASSSQVMSLIYDGLILMGDDRNYQPALGKQFEINSDGIKQTIELNVDEGIKFHNGKEFTADDVVFTFKRFLEESLIRSWAVGTMRGVEKIDDKTVMFTFEKPYSFFQPHVSANSYFGILPTDLGRKSAEEFGQEPIGTGPYKFEEWAKGEQITLVRNDNWKTPTYPIVKTDDPPLPKKIIWQVIPQATPRVQALLTGDIDVLTGIPSRKVSRIKNSDKAKVHSAIGGSISYVAMHNHLAPTDDINVRKAIARAIDKTRILEDIYHGEGKVNYSPMPIGYPPWAGEAVQKQVGYVYDPKRAEELLSKAGWKETDGKYRKKNGETLSLSMISGNAPPTTLQASEEIAAMLKNVGIKVNISVMPTNQAYAKIENGNTNIMYAGLSWFTADVMQFMLASENAGASNISFLKDKKVDRYLDRAAETLDNEKRKEIYEKMQLRVMELCALNPIMTPSSNTAIRSEFEGHHYISSSNSNIWLDMHIKNE